MSRLLPVAAALLLGACAGCAGVTSPTPPALVTLSTHATVAQARPSPQPNYLATSTSLVPLADLQAIVSILADRFSNLQIVYLSSRTYGGYATTALNPEPYAYESGFAVKWTIAANINDRTERPWLAWGPCLWTGGTKRRSDSLV